MSDPAAARLRLEALERLLDNALRDCGAEFVVRLPAGVKQHIINELLTRYRAKGWHVAYSNEPTSGERLTFQRLVEREEWGE